MKLLPLNYKKYFFYKSQPIICNYYSYAISLYTSLNFLFVLSVEKLDFVIIVNA